jgi:hypothetical protein
MTDAELEDKLAKLEALFRRAGTAGEAKAAGAALDRLSKRKRTRQTEQGMTFSNPWSVRLFVALCRKHGVEPYRYPRQRRTTVMMRVDGALLNGTILPQFEELEKELYVYVNDLTDHLIANGLGSDGDDTRMAAPPALPKGSE